MYSASHFVITGFRLAAPSAQVPSLGRQAWYSGAKRLVSTPCHNRVRSGNRLELSTVFLDEASSPSSDRSLAYGSYPPLLTPCHNWVSPRIRPITSRDSLGELHSPSVVHMLVYGLMGARLHTLSFPFFFAIIENTEEDNLQLLDSEFDEMMVSFLI